jgi:uncharacterized protein YndB with AHSA1/START domain
MNNQPLVVERTYDAPVSRVWQAITNIEQMRQWYFDIADFRPELGFEFQFSGCSDNEEFIHHCRVTAVIPEKKISHTWVYEGHEGSSEVTWELFPEGDKTKLVLTHTGLESFPNKPDFAVSSFSAGWNDILGRSLKEFVEKELVS